MGKIQKFILEEFPKSSVVNSNVYASDHSEIDKMINNVVSEHLSTIVGSDNIENINVADSGVVSQGNKVVISSEKTIDDSVKNHNIENMSQSDERGGEYVIDIEQERQLAYDKAVKELEANHKEQLAAIESDNNFAELLKTKLEVIVPHVDIDSQIAKVSAEAIVAIARKLHFILPVDFEQIVQDGLIKKLESVYKEGEIILTVHPDRYDLCVKILKLDEIPTKFKDNIKIVKDNKLGVDDCKLESEDTRLEYNKEQLSLEIDKIIDQLNNT